MDAKQACVQFAQAAADGDKTAATCGQSRQAAARAYGTLHLQVLCAVAGQSRDRELDIWQRHHARVTVTAMPVAGPTDVDDAKGSDTQSPPDRRTPPRTQIPPSTQTAPGAPLAIRVTGLARSWTTLIAPYRVDYLSSPAATG